MSTAEPDLGDVHLDVMGAVVVAAVGVERAAGRPLRGVQDVLQRGERLVGQMADLEVDGSARRLDLALHLGHHLAGPVVGVDEPLACGVDLVATERVGHVCAGGPVVVLDQWVDLEAFDTRQLRTSVIGHRVAVARVGRVLVGAVEVSRGGQTEPTTRTGRQDHRLRADDHELPGAAVQGGRPDRPPVSGEHPHRHQPVLDADLVAHGLLPHHPVERLLDVLALGHRQHVGARAVHAAHGILAVLVLLELHAVAFEPLHHREAARRGLIDGALIDDSVVGAGDLGDVVLGFGLAGDDGVVHPVHAHGERARMTHVRLLQQQHLRALLGSGERCHRPGSATADHQNVAVEAHGVVEMGCQHQFTSSE